MQQGLRAVHTSLQGFQGKSWQGPAPEQLAVQQWLVQWSERRVGGVGPPCPQAYSCDSRSTCTEAHRVLQPVGINAP